MSSNGTSRDAGRFQMHVAGRPHLHRSFAIRGVNCDRFPYEAKDETRNSVISRTPFGCLAASRASLRTSGQQLG